MKVFRSIYLCSVGWLMSLLAGCTGGTSAPAPVADAVPAYVPHLGEMMNGVQVHHAKLYWAGAAGNWELADFCLEELTEDLEKIPAYHPTHGGADLDRYLQALMTPALDTVSVALKTTSIPRFEAAYGVLTQACNNCHRATGHPYLVMQKPAVNNFPNQTFTP
ncbi:MAG: hypothetical protein SF053_11080 [Bacteroidia bacterium]|nr:hypothetical protein [Bacteroidia bacterium]